MPLIGDRIAWARKRAGYRSQDSFAAALGVSRGLVGQWEAHGKRPGRDNLTKIAAKCGISVDYLLGATTLDQRTITTSVEREVQLLLDFRQMTDIQQKRFLEYAAEGAEVARLMIKKREKA
jgi:transcriptional regulator with XRE-family HTH domain